MAFGNDFFWVALQKLQLNFIEMLVNGVLDAAILSLQERKPSGGAERSEMGTG